MTPFNTVEAPAAVLDRANVDTDQIIPARFLRKPRDAGYGSFLFADLRRDPDFPPSFPLGAARRGGAAVLVADANFGCGSSREGAVYALVDAGFRCVVAPSFGDIFAGNAAKNGLLLVTLPAAQCARLRDGLRGGRTVRVDLPAQCLHGPDGQAIHFEIDPFRKRCLLEGLDEIGLTLEHEAGILAWERADAAARPWAAPV